MKQSMDSKHYHDYKSSYGDEMHGANGYRRSPKLPKRNPRNLGGSLLLLLLCAAISFAAGYGGARFARGTQEPGTTEEADTTSPLYESPEEIVDRAESENSPFGSAGEDVFTVSQTVEMVHDSVVVISVSIKGSFGYQTQSSSGSGVLISENGYILTCHHVIEDATDISVTLNSGDIYDAVLVGSDKASDLAVIRIYPKEDERFPFAKHGRSSDLVLGEKVIAIGNPLGTLGGSVTDGIISAIERKVTVADGSSMTLLQTNAAVNSGNSGGGLFNLDGELIGIVNAKYAAEGVEGLAFAIPIDSAYEVEMDLIQYGYVRGVVDHGMELLDVTASELKYYYYQYAIDTVGVYVVSSAFSEELLNKDRIVSVNEQAVTTAAELNAIVKQLSIGDTVTLVIDRSEKNGNEITHTELTVELVLQEYVPESVSSRLQ